MARARTPGTLMARAVIAGGRTAISRSARARDGPSHTPGRPTFCAKFKHRQKTPWGGADCGHALRETTSNRCVCTVYPCFCHDHCHNYPQPHRHPSHEPVKAAKPTSPVTAPKAPKASKAAKPRKKAAAERRQPPSQPPRPSRTLEAAAAASPPRPQVQGQKAQAGP